MVVASGWVLTRLEMHLVLPNTKPPIKKKRFLRKGLCFPSALEDQHSVLSTPSSSFKSFLDLATRQSSTRFSKTNYDIWLPEHCLLEACNHGATLRFIWQLLANTIPIITMLFLRNTWPILWFPPFGQRCRYLTRRSAPSIVNYIIDMFPLCLSNNNDNRQDIVS